MAATRRIIVGRIETLKLDAVVNAANRELRPGSGVDGALRAAAGPELTRHTDKLGPLDEGGAVLTPGFRLPARHIIHTAAPVYFLDGDEASKIEVLRRCYASCITLADAHGLKSIAFPCLGTGIYGWPRKLAYTIALSSTAETLANAPTLSEVVFCCFTEDDAEIYRAALS
ncbi:MAG: macro domain-containing protein [Hyphomonadaceae bacterium]|nr:macro domain-containing protein [Hyphomonadaceae bacterium]